MANPRIPFKLITEQPKLTPPAGGSILVYLVVNIENWEFKAAMPRTIITPPQGKETIPDVPNFSWVDYGMRVGLPRIIKAITTRNLPATVSFNASVIDAYPSASKALLDTNWEFIGHGMFQKALNYDDNEEANISAALEKINAFTGKKTRGWLSPGLRESYDTPDILARLGVDYLCDWVVDDIPNWMNVKSGKLLQVPYNLELNDSIIYAIEKHSSAEFYLRLEQTLKVLEQEADDQPRVLALGLHPHLIGVPHRFAYFEKMLDMLVNHSKTTFMTGGQIADWYQEQQPAPEI